MAVQGYVLPLLLICQFGKLSVFQCESPLKSKLLLNFQKSNCCFYMWTGSLVEVPSGWSRSGCVCKCVSLNWECARFGSHHLHPCQQFHVLEELLYVTVFFAWRLGPCSVRLPSRWGCAWGDRDRPSAEVGHWADLVNFLLHGPRSRSS